MYFEMEHKIMFVLIPSLVIIVVFLLTIQDSFGETRVECRSLVMSDKSLTPVERHYALKTCSPSQSTISPFEQYYTEELHNECTRIVKENSHLNHIQRLNDLKECNKLQKYDSSFNSQKITKFSRTTIEICDEKYEIYLLVGAKNMRNQAGGLAEQCVQLYLTPMWNSTAYDRNVQLHHFILDKVKQSVKEDEDLRQKFVEEAQLSDPVFFHLKYLFDEQKEKIEYMENQLQEKNIVPDYSKQDFFNETYEDCLKIIYDKTLVGAKKIHALDKCSHIEMYESNTFNDEKILEYSKDLVQLCEKSYDIFLKLGRGDYYASIKNSQERGCAVLYTDPIWKYNEDDRIQVIEKFVYDKILDNNRIYIERKESVKEANLSAGLVPILSDLYKYQKQKIEMLENKLEKTEDNNKEKIQNTKNEKTETIDKKSK